jgi:adenylylsulfate kinase-like enzyme
VAALLTGVYGSGKTAVAEEMTSVLEERELAYAALDLDWLGWFEAGGDHDVEHAMMLRNLDALVRNYLSAGVGYFVLALAVDTRDELESIRAVLPMPLTVVMLTAPFTVVEARLRAYPTAARKLDLEWAGEWLAEQRGQGLEDFEVANDREIRDVAVEVLTRLGWI